MAKFIKEDCHRHVENEQPGLVHAMLGVRIDVCSELGDRGSVEHDIREMVSRVDARTLSSASSLEMMATLSGKYSSRRRVSRVYCSLSLGLM